jgi:hypothetical protein
MRRIFAGILVTGLLMVGSAQAVRLSPSFVKHLQRTYSCDSVTAVKIGGNLVQMQEWKTLLKKGSRVRLGRHTMVRGNRGWKRKMARYVGRTVVVTGFSWEKRTFEPLALVKGNPYRWRLRNFARPVKKRVPGVVGGKQNQ